MRYYNKSVNILCQKFFLKLYIEASKKVKKYLSQKYLILYIIFNINNLS